MLEVKRGDQRSGDFRHGLACKGREGQYAKTACAARFPSVLHWTLRRAISAGTNVPVFSLAERAGLFRVHIETSGPSAGSRS